MAGLHVARLPLLRGHQWVTPSRARAGIPCRLSSNPWRWGTSCRVRPGGTKVRPGLLRLGRGVTFLLRQEVGRAPQLAQSPRGHQGPEVLSLSVHVAWATPTAPCNWDVRLCRRTGCCPQLSCWHPADAGLRPRKGPVRPAWGLSLATGHPCARGVWGMCSRSRPSGQRLVGGPGPGPSGLPAGPRAL